MNEFTENIANPVPGSARVPGIANAIAAGFRFRSWDDEDRKPEDEGITSEEYDTLAAWDRAGVFA